MTTLQHWNDVDSDFPLEREVVALTLFLSIIELYAELDKPTLSIGVPIMCYLAFRGNDRVIGRSDLEIMMAMLEITMTDNNDQFSLDYFLALLIILGQDDIFQHFDMPILPNIRVDLNSLSQSDCRRAFRFDQDELKKIVSMLPFPEIIITEHRDKVHILEAFALVNRRMAYPNRWCDLHQQFGRSTSALSRTFNLMLGMLIGRVRKSVMFYPLEHERYDEYCDAFVRKGADPELRIVVVIDAKKLMSCRPTHYQRSQYDRHKKGHGLKFQTLEGPDGLGISCTNSFDGRRGDGYIFRKSNLENFWKSNPSSCNYRKIADSAYPTTNWTLSLFKKVPGQNMDADCQAFNNRYSPLRTCVEWGYGKIVKHWAFIDFRKQMRIENSRMEAMWQLAFWLTNVVTCACGSNQISEFFELVPPTLEEYLTKSLEL